MMVFMVTVEEIRQAALSLPRAYEALVRDRVKFRVGRIVFVALSRDEQMMGCGFPREERAAAVEAYPAKFVMPGTSPACAICRRHSRQSPKSRYTERARPQRRQRVYARTLNLGFRCCFWMRAFFATFTPAHHGGTGSQVHAGARVPGRPSLP